MQSKNRSPHTMHGYLNCFNSFCKWLSPDGKPAHCTTTLADIDRPLMLNFFVYLREHYSDNYALNHYIALKNYFDVCIDYDELEPDHNPLRWVERPKPHIEPPDILSDAQIRALLGTCERGRDFKSRRDYALIRVFLSTGMRLAEMTGLELGDVHLDDGAIVVRHAKGGRTRTAGIGVRTVRAIGHYLHLRARHNHADLPALWLSQRGAMAGQTIYGMIVARAQAAHLEDMHPHLFRHWFAHGYLAGGGQESALLQLAGWRDSKMIRERYGASLASERAVHEHHRLGIGEQW